MQSVFLDDEYSPKYSSYLSTKWDKIDDKLFLLSVDDIEDSDFVKESAESYTTGTDYAKCQGFSSGWWLRNTIGMTDCSNYSTNNVYSFDTVTATNHGIRPACWIKL